MRHCTPLELYAEVKRILGDSEMNTLEEEAFAQWPVDDIMSKISDVLDKLFVEFQASHGSMWVRKETITVVSGTQEYVISDADSFHGALSVFDANDVEVPIEQYDYEQKRENAGENVCWIRTNSSGQLVLGFLYPDSCLGDVTLRYLATPPRFIGGQGVGYDATPFWYAGIPFYGPSTAGYYDTNDRVEVGVVSNGKIITRYIASVTEATATQVRFDDGPTTEATRESAIWGVIPRWAPREAKSLICVRAAIELHAGTEMSVPQDLYRLLNMATLEFRAGYDPEQATVLAPRMLREDYDG